MGLFVYHRRYPRLCSCFYLSASSIWVGRLQKAVTPRSSWVDSLLHAKLWAFHCIFEQTIARGIVLRRRLRLCYGLYPCSPSEGRQSSGATLQLQGVLSQSQESSRLYKTATPPSRLFTLHRFPIMTVQFPIRTLTMSSLERCRMIGARGRRRGDVRNLHLKGPDRDVSAGEKIRIGTLRDKTTRGTKVRIGTYSSYRKVRIRTF